MYRSSNMMSKYGRYYSIISTKSVVLSTNLHRVQDNIPINKTLLITHGLMGSKQNWNSLSKNLRHKFKEVIGIDLRNHGDSPHIDDMSIESMAGDIHQLVLTNGYTTPILVGHSLGGKVAMQLALQEPELLSGLVVVDISPVGTYQVSQFQTYIECMVRAPIDQSLSLFTNRKKIDEFMQADIENPDIRNFLLTNLIKDSLSNHIRWRINLQSISKNIGQFFEFTPPQAGVFNKPVLFIGGKKSDYIKHEHWPLILQLFPAASLKIIDDAGHWVHADKPHEFMELLVQFGLDLQSNDR